MGGTICEGETGEEVEGEREDILMCEKIIEEGHVTVREGFDMSLERRGSVLNNANQWSKEYLFWPRKECDRFQGYL
jgi:hypothetical protein